MADIDYSLFLHNPLYSLKAGYAAHILLQCRFFAGSVFLHPSASPRKLGRIPYAIMVRPTILTLSTHPDLGNQSKHQELHRCALWRLIALSWQSSWLEYCTFYGIYYIKNQFMIQIDSPYIITYPQKTTTFYTKNTKLTTQNVFNYHFIYFLILLFLSLSNSKTGIALTFIPYFLYILSTSSVVNLSNSIPSFLHTPLIL